MTMSEPVPYEEVNLELTAEQAAAQRATLFPSETDPTEIVVVGPCPRCNDETRHVEPLDRLRTAEAKQPVAEHTFPVLCDCGVDHAAGDDAAAGGDDHAAGIVHHAAGDDAAAGGDDAAATRRGCGAAWQLTVDWG